jgi:23S rRNA (adenine2503-C2)-methyltransferase
MQKKDIRHLAKEELMAFLKERGEKAFRYKQIMEWVWLKNAASIDAMTNIPLGLRQELAKTYSISRPFISAEQQSSDGTRKYAFSLADKLMVEAVLIPSGSRTTACISTQVGCALACKFCATAKLGFKRNLEYFEIYDQIAFVNARSEEYYGHKLNNVVYMGMGEPLLNIENTLKSLERVSSPEALAMSPKRITVSTVGIPPGIIRLADANPGTLLALSLHSAKDHIRDYLMPVNHKYKLKEVGKALAYYHNKTAQRIHIEYLMLKDVNDSISDAKALAVFCKSFPVKINLIEYNSTADSEFNKTEADKLQAFVDYLEGKNIIVNIRKSRGEDIDAACGQLANKIKE